MKNEKNINDKNLNLTYKMFLGKTLKEPLTINNKTYPVDTVLTKQMIDDIIAVNKINALGKFVNM